MRSLFVLCVCVCAFGVATLGCGGDDDGTGGSGGSGGTAGSGGMAGSGGTAGSGGMAGSGGAAGTGGTAGSGGIAPVVERIDWVWVRPCDNFTEDGQMTVTITARDDDTDLSELTYSGPVGDFDACTDITAMETTVTCPPYIGLRSGNAIVTDPQGNQGMLSFGFDPCTDGSVCEGGTLCP